MASTLPNILDCCDECVTCEAVDIVGPSASTMINTLSVETIADLRLVATRYTRQFVVVAGGVTAYDGLGGVYVWDAAYNVADDGVSVIKPSDVLAGTPGRFRKLI